MNLKYILIVWGAMLFCVGCSEDDVDSSYSFDVAGLKATVTNDKGSVVEMNTILLDSLQQQGFVGEVSFSEETRAENDRLAEEKFADLHSFPTRRSSDLVCYSFYPEKGSW